MFGSIALALLAVTSHGPVPNYPAGITFDLRRGQFTIELPAADLPAQHGYGAAGVVVSREVPISENVWIHGYRVEVIDGNGAVIKAQVLHHLNVIDHDRRELFSPVMLRIAAAGRETGDVLLKNWIGLPLPSGSRLTVSAMLM